MVNLACSTIWVMATDAGRKIESSVATLSLGLCPSRGWESVADTRLENTI